MNIQRDVPLASLTTFRVGGTASHVATVSDLTFADAVRFARDHALPIRILGGGSNVLVSDDGMRALVLRYSGAAISHTPDGVLRVGAAALWDDVAQYSIDHGLAGIECLSGVPGQAGASPVQNIGCYGQQISDTLESVHAVDLTDGSRVVFSARDCKLGYRTSIFNTSQSDRYCVTEIQLRLIPGGTPCRSYADIIEATDEDVTLSALRDAVLDIRKRKGMLVGMSASAGSFFKAATVNQDVFERVCDTLAVGAPNAHWYWQLGGDRVKIAAGRIVERFFPRGYRFGAAGISPTHALALVAYPGAKARDVIALARHIQETVAGETGIILEPEVRLWGFETYPLLR